MLGQGQSSMRYVVAFFYSPCTVSIFVCVRRKRGKKMGSIEWVVDHGHREFMKCRHINKLIDRKWERFAAESFEVRARVHSCAFVCVW